ncbi:YetF domain-containing protein [Niallia sp. 03133]|uniref:YetF domain-containing protein n=1 Tax=Niallia sp. 03133 TaxID=3458060 RepID=UPI004044369A
MKKNNLDFNQLQHLLRAKDIFSVAECSYAILETDGTVSVRKKSANFNTNKTRF